MDLTKITPQTIYVLQIISANMITFMSSDTSRNVQCIDFSETRLDEQGSEALFKRIKELHKRIGEAIEYYEMV
jgi:hypothetical protein